MKSSDEPPACEYLMYGFNPSEPQWLSVHISSKLSTCACAAALLPMDAGFSPRLTRSSFIKSSIRISCCAILLTHCREYFCISIATRKSSCKTLTSIYWNRSQLVKKKSVFHEGFDSISRFERVKVLRSAYTLHEFLHVAIRLNFLSYSRILFECTATPIRCYLYVLSPIGSDLHRRPRYAPHL